MNDIVVVFGIQEPELFNDDVDALADLHQKYESARRLIFALTSSKGGRIIGQVHGHEIVTLPIGQAEVIKEIHARLKDELHCPCNIGVGEDTEQAIAAMEYGQENAPDSIKVFTNEMKQGDELDAEPHPRSEKEEEQENMLTKAEYMPISNEEKLKIALIMETIKKNKPLFDQLMQEAPDVYASVVSVAQSLANMLKEDKRARDEHIVEMIGKINDHLGRHTERAANKQAKQIQKEIDSHYQDKNEQDMKIDEGQKKLILQRRKSQRKSALEFAKKTGHHDFNFLMKLNGAFRK